MRWWTMGLALVAATASLAYVAWGFYAHRQINRFAVYTVPERLAGFYKANVEFVAAHAVDPDKRRYAASLEGPRHYIDLERFGGDLDALPVRFDDFHRAFTFLYCVDGADSARMELRDGAVHVAERRYPVDEAAYKKWYGRVVLPAYRRELTQLPYDSPAAPDLRCDRLSLVDTMTQHGILPYHLEYMQERLTQAFRQKKPQRALQLSAEIGHYIGDATVPLHTTENYNGQLTGQRGIHGFWESRIPELFAEEEFDVLVGSARYIDDKPAFFRDLVRTSHEHVDSVLLIEAELRRKLPASVQDCYEERLGRVVRVPCRDFARAYYERMDGMVEERFRTAIRSVGSAWYTAWVDAGKPELPNAERIAVIEVDSLRPVPSDRGRGH